jgi:Asp-tRNA(Asn)/Glu-tRNA(Gln) amidotransferase C subunit
MRDDKNSHEPELFTEPILKQAPLTENGYIKVKKILTS